MSLLRLLLGAMATVVVASGCATAPFEAQVGQRTPNPDELTQWTAKGRIALVARGEGGSGSFVWGQRSERTELTVRGPLGAGGVQLVTDGATFELADGSGQPLDGDAARTELERRLGARLPVAELRYWLLGLPAPQRAGSGAVQMATGSVPGFVQDGWVVSFEEYQPQGRWTLPVRLTATTSSARVRIVVDDWILPTP